MDAFMGTVLAVGFNYPPRGWLFCNGQTVPIQQNSAMFALLGTMYGGDGQTTFGIPDLRGRVVVGSQAQGPGLQNVAQGEKAGTNNTTVISTGTASTTLTTANLPAHNHTATTTVNVSTGAGGVNPTPNASLCQAAAGTTAAAIYTTAPSGTVALGGVGTTTANTGAGQPMVIPVTTMANISNMQPYLGLNYIIAMEGIFPSRN
jgi:microcystin-dependent protein